MSGGAESISVATANEGSESDELLPHSPRGRRAPHRHFDSGSGGHRSRSSSQQSLLAHRSPAHARNLAAFWLLGLCNNFAYVVMLSAAVGILQREDGGGGGSGSERNGTTAQCVDDTSKLPCSEISTGAVLLADILPSLAIKMLAPFTLQSIPYSVRHLFVVAFQALSLLIVALSNSLFLGITGVVFASIGAGLGEISYLSMSSHFHQDVVSSWSSGTGGAGIAGSFAFAVLTDAHLGNLSPKTALLLMLVVPMVMFTTYAYLLRSPHTVHKVLWRQPRSYTIPRRAVVIEEAPIRRSISNGNDEPHSPAVAAKGIELLRKVKPLLRFMLPLFLVYFFEYFINQGLMELLVFPCATGLYLNQASQYRWMQALYQMGVFVSRSSVRLFPIKVSRLPVLAVLQCINALLLFNTANSPWPLFPHILALFAFIFYEGLLGGSAYVNTFAGVHKQIPSSDMEFSMGFVALSDSVGIVMAGFTAIYVHNYICSRKTPL